MVIENTNQNEQQEIVKQENSNETNTIENVLQNKFQDPTKVSFFIDIFNDPQIQTNYAQQTITSFIQGDKKISKFYRTNQTTEHNEKIKKIIEMIDIFEQNNGNKTNTNVSDILENKIDQKENKIDQKENINLKTEAINKQAKLTKESYDKLPPKYQISNEQIAEIKSNEKNKKFINNLINTIQGTNLSVDDYLKFYITAKNNKEELKGSEFMKNYEKLYDMIYTTNMGELAYNTNKTDNIGKQLYTDLQPSSKLNTLTIPHLPNTPNLEDEFTTYVKFITDQDLQNRIIRNEEIIKKYNQENEEEKIKDEEGAKAYKEYKTAIQTIQEELPTKTQDIVKQRVLGICITGLAKYFDTTTINQENLANNFAINTQEGFSIQKGEKEYNEEGDDVLYIHGNINGNSVGFYYNLDNPDAQLKSEDFLSFDDKSKTFTFGAGTGGKTKLGVKLPTLGLLTSQAQTIVDKNFTNNIKEAKDLQDFEAIIKEKISKELLKNYGRETLVKTRIERDCEKNISIQTLQNIFIPDVVISELNQDKSINETTEKNTWELLKIRDKTTENMTSNELRMFRSLITRLNQLITKQDEKNHNNLEPKRQKLLKDIENEKGAVSYNSDRGKSMVKFFKKFSKNNEIQIDDLEIFITILEKKENIGDNINKFSTDFQTNEEQENADELIKTI